MMSSSAQEIDVLEPRKSSRKRFDEILVLADDLLKDECPINQVEEWLYRIDDTLLQLKLWGETVGVEQGLLEDIVLDKDLSLVIGEVLCSIILPLHKIEVWCEDPEAIELPQIKSRISAAIDEFQVSTNSLTDMVELFRNYKAKSNNKSFLQDFKPTGSITEYLYGADSHHIAKEQQQQRISDIPLLPSQLVKDSPYSVFLQGLAAMPEQEKRVIRIGELPVLRQQILDRMKHASIHSAIGDHEKNVIFEVAVTLSHFHAAWLETASTMDSAGSDTTSKVYGLPHMAKIWYILNGMGSGHLLDSFCASRMTDESLPLDILTLESILPPAEELYPSHFYKDQFFVVPPPQGFYSREDVWYQGSVPIDGPYLELPEASSESLSRTTLSRASLAGTTPLTGDPPVEETALNQPTSTKKAFASTSSYTDDPTVEGTFWNQRPSTKRGFASTSSYTDDPTVEGTFWNQRPSTKRGFASTSSDPDDPTVEGTFWNQRPSTKRGFASTSSDPDDPTVDEPPNLR